MQSSGPAALPESDLNVANQRLAAAESNLSLLQSGGAATLKQKMLIKKAEEHVAEMRKAQETAACALPPAPLHTPPSQSTNTPPSQSQSAPLFTRVKSISAFQSSFKLANSGQQKLSTEQELAKVRAIVLKTRGFSSLDQGNLDKMMSSGLRKAYDKEELLIMQGDTDLSYFFVLIEGCFKFVCVSEPEDGKLKKEEKSGLINSGDHGNVVGHFGSLYRRARDSSVHSVAGAVAWRFSFEGVPGLPPAAPQPPKQYK